MSGNQIDLKEISLDVWERCLFWLCVSYIVANIGSFIGFSWIFIFFTILICSCVGVVLLDRVVVDPNGKAVLITGCDTGFGFNTAKKLHALGYTIFAGVISTETDGAKSLKKEFKERMFTVQMNVTSDEDVNKALEYVKENLPSDCEGLWAVITNAGWSTFGEVEMVPLDVYQKIMEINLFGTIRTIKAALPLLRLGKGRVITVASMMGRFGAASRSPYCCTKWAVEGLSECLRAEMKRWKVHVTVIEPGNFIAGTALYAGDAITKQADHMWNNLSDAVKNDYGKENFDAAIKKMLGYTSGGNCSIEPVLKAMCDAVSHTYPQTRYQIMSPDEKLKCFMATHLPSILYDKLYN